MIALIVQGACAAGEVASSAPNTLPAEDVGTNSIAAPWRDPFWPVGYVPTPDAASAAVTNAPVAVADSQARWQEARKRLQIQGLTRNRSRYLVVINGRMVETGDRVSVELAGVRYRWLVQAIASQGVTLEKVDAIAVPVGGAGGK